MLTPLKVGAYWIKELPVEEWGRLSEADGPLHGHTLPPTDTARIITIQQEDGRICAYWIASGVVHLDPLWLDEEVRRMPKLGFAFLGAMATALQESDVRYAYAIIADGDQPVNGELAEALGFEKMPGSLYGGFLRKDE